MYGWVKMTCTYLKRCTVTFWKSQVAVPSGGGCSTELLKAGWRRAQWCHSRAQFQSSHIAPQSRRLFSGCDPAGWWRHTGCDTQVWCQTAVHGIVANTGKEEGRQWVTAVAWGGIGRHWQPTVSSFQDFSWNRLESTYSKGLPCLWS